MLTPYRMDTNSLYLTEQLNLLGVDVIFKSIVGDDLRRLVAAAQHGLFRSDILIFSGGLGPTEDDLTREAVAEALGVSLRRDPEILARLEQRFAERGWKMARQQRQAGRRSRGRHRASQSQRHRARTVAQRTSSTGANTSSCCCPALRTNSKRCSKRSARAPARQSSSGFSRHPHAEDRDAGRIRGRRARRPHLQALRRRRDHHPGRRRRNRTALQNARRHARRGAAPRR